jgi:hypothetical protein
LIEEFKEWLTTFRLLDCRRNHCPKFLKQFIIRGQWLHNLNWPRENYAHTFRQWN